ncbi:hypothetical protein K431DRAFT_64882 [Polychaeton citri CBS 116435]|uniref:Uncharacterized protein n=1 Tax=Polychaeton citri CBS 116435 TaxID=1314669 RepID=A0A9P4UPJ2_9PEZI|nr:hypothetical protein K431DRAFT_64882 [Polychaeton citri CBS 116435]
MAAIGSCSLSNVVYADYTTRYINHLPFCKASEGGPGPHACIGVCLFPSTCSQLRRQYIVRSGCIALCFEEILPQFYFPSIWNRGGEVARLLDRSIVGGA